MNDLLQSVDEWGPEKIVCVSDSRSGMRGVLVVDNTARGTGKGGIRMSPTVNVAEIARLARVMTWKWAAADLFHGGAKAGIVADPSAPGKERIVRAFARKLSDQIPASYVAGLDMGMTERDAAIIQDELGDRGTAVGVPEVLGGVPYDELGVTGHGVVAALSAALELHERPMAGVRVAVQGFGAVGAAAVRRLHELGAQVVALSTVDGGVHDADGLDVPSWLARRAEYGDACVQGAPAAKRLERGEELLVDCDVLIPAAGQDVLGERVAAGVRADIIVEGANLPTTPGARAALAARGVTVVPDFIANAGGAIAAGFAMDARRSAFRPAPERILDEVAERCRANARLVLRAAREHGVDPHTAALDTAKSRVRAAMELRGRLASVEAETIGAGG
ncbi:Glu/Leu/Phe/Val dehydrogenase [Saccharopolyspora gloriosae]|uniref:Glu/Leu/Phe/Val family dehydrogenase n=1 Tax=Saccharopolyspora gloriosae TaxID=455344 RepID=UPI001FB65913|nr:Glu/Leu/Phe/Val dehydrogenase dimerization domain-containing protein [Saccharopolyspora gloriosae]